MVAVENFDEFGKMNVIHQYFAQPNSRFTEVAKGYSLNLPNVFLSPKP